MVHILRCLLVSLFIVPLAMAHDVPKPAPSLEALLAPIAQDRLFKDASIGLHVVSIRTGEEVYGHQADDLFIPASTMKVLTSAAALRHLGPSYTFHTATYRTGTVKSGVLEGDLYVRGGADPTFVIEKLWKLAYDIKLEGIETINGDVVVDDSFLSTEFAIPGWDKQEDIDKGASYFPTIGATTLNFGTVALVIGPGDKDGEPGTVVIETPTSGHITVDNRVTTVGSKGRRRVDVSRTVTAEGLILVASGQVPAEATPRRYYRAVTDPTAYFEGAFKNMLEEVGIKVKGSYRRGVTPESASLVVEWYSPPLGSILMDMNKYSSNFIAECVLRTLGAEARGDGSTDGGLAVVAEYLATLGIKADDYSATNGSGLSLESRLAPSHLTAVLLDMASDPRVGPEFISSLSIAGQDGTLSRRLDDAPGRLRGKTGTINGIHCLTGYVESEDGEMFAFAFLVNEVSGGLGKVKTLHDGFARAMFTASTSGGSR